MEARREKDEEKQYSFASSPHPILDIVIIIAIEIPLGEEVEI